MKSESIIKGVSIGISTAILWSIVLNSKVALFLLKKIKIRDDTTSSF